ncbi:MAG: hypothetical protein H6822_11570 [Planctomycetaceae bacterium]|nr:hypothetical protein [Planctomycetales bacterium]MCB9922814.1 hypothetical protein [Planctomycetaceae bacterium]
MIQNASFQRKVLYLGLIALLLIPLYVIGHPATKSTSNRGGQLAQLRADYDLSPTELGEIDPASESMKLATLGMKGVAANILWTKANHYKKTEDWEKLVATVNTMSKLQPHFISVWEFQSHNLSYNISVEHDDFRFRYLWVKKGIEFLIKGTRYNQNEPKLFWTVGWYTGQKFGRADEHKQFRRLFQDDKDFHALLSQYVDIDTEARGADQRPDNWLTSRLWYESAYDIVETRQAPIRGKAPHIFYSDGPKALMNYANTIETEGVLDEKAQYAWRRAGENWDTYGTRVVPTSWGTRIRLNDEEAALAEAQRLSNELDKLLPGLRERLKQERIDALTEAERVAMAKTWDEITGQIEGNRKQQAEQKTTVTYRDVAEASPEDVRARAFRLAKQASDKETEAKHIDSYRNNVNFNYWKARCAVEQMPKTVNARRHVFAAKQHMEDADPDAARTEFELAWKDWAETFQEHRGLVNELTEDDLVEDIQLYIKLLGQLDEELPANFALNEILAKYEPFVAEESAAPETESTAEHTEDSGAKEAAPEKSEPSNGDDQEKPDPADAKKENPADKTTNAEATKTPAEAAAEKPASESPSIESPTESQKPTAVDDEATGDAKSE